MHGRHRFGVGQLRLESRGDGRIEDQVHLAPKFGHALALHALHRGLHRLGQQREHLRVQRLQDLAALRTDFREFGIRRIARRQRGEALAKRAVRRLVRRDRGSDLRARPVVDRLQLRRDGRQQLRAEAGATLVGGVDERIAQAVERRIRQRAVQPIDGRHAELQHAVDRLALASASAFLDRLQIGLAARGPLPLELALPLERRLEPCLRQFARHRLELAGVLPHLALQRRAGRLVEAKARDHQPQVEDGRSTTLRHGARSLDRSLHAQRVKAFAPVRAEALAPLGQQSVVERLEPPHQLRVAARQLRVDLRHAVGVPIAQLQRSAQFADAITDGPRLPAREFAPLLEIAIVCRIDAAPGGGFVAKPERHQRDGGEGSGRGVEADLRATAACERAGKGERDPPCHGSKVRAAQAHGGILSEIPFAVFSRPRDGSKTSPARHKPRKEACFAQIRRRACIPAGELDGVVVG